MSARPWSNDATASASGAAEAAPGEGAAAARRANVTRQAAKAALLGRRRGRRAGAGIGRPRTIHEAFRSAAAGRTGVIHSGGRMPRFRFGPALREMLDGNLRKGRLGQNVG